jgi:7-keto-8-aminopelargonate synthetase-like enzyme
MENLSPQVIANRNVSKAKELGLIQVNVEKIGHDGKSFEKNGKQIKYFTSCSYVGLENDIRLKNAAIEAMSNFGVQFSSSRAFLEIPLYSEVESLLTDIFERPTLLAPTTSLGHMSLIPFVVGKDDLLVLDKLVHSSVQVASGLAKGNGTEMTILKHNRMDELEDLIQKSSSKYSKIWYMIDSVYSMHGDVAPLEEIVYLLNRYENFYCYVDDAHGMSWAGKHGRGYVFDKIDYHEKMVFITTLAKGFGVSGSAMVFHSEEMKNISRNISPALMFSGPIQPANLGALLESSKIHLSDEIYERQDKLKDLIRYFTITAKGLGLPLVSEDLTPIFFIGVGSTEIGFELAKRMLEDGFYINIAGFPAVAHNKAGLRITVTHHLSIEDIYEMLSRLASHFADMEKKNHIVKENIYKAFALAY